MIHRLTVQNASMGLTYEVRLEIAGAETTAIWRTLDGNGDVVAGGPSGRLVHADAHAAWKRAKRTLEDADEGVIDQDWDFGDPPPPWLTE